jgi:hypothetical protein
MADSKRSEEHSRFGRSPKPAKKGLFNRIEAKLKG